MSALTALEKNLIYAVLALLCLLLAGTITYFSGYHRCERQDKVAVAKDEVHNARVEDSGLAADIKADTKYAASLTLALAPLPDVSRLHQPSNCPVPHPVAAAGTDPPALRIEPPAGVVQPDWHPFERSDVQDGHDADAEVIWLQAKLADMYAVCTGKIIGAR